mgnify:CR=1 FL=1
MDFDILLQDVDRPSTLLLENIIEETIEGLIKDLEVFRAKHRDMLSNICRGCMTEVPSDDN